MSHSTPGRPDTPDPARRAARPPRRACGRGARPDRHRPRSRDRPRLRARRAGGRPRGRGRDPVRGPARLAGGDRAGTRRPAAPRARWRGGPWSCSRAASTCTRATTRASSSSRSCCSRQLGARIVVLTNAAGGLDPSFGPGTLMVMRDHINLTGRSPLIGPNADELGPRFPDLTDAWDPRLRERLHAAGRGRGHRTRGGDLRRPDRADLRDPGRGPDAGRPGRPCRRHVDRARMHRRPLGRPRRCAASRWSPTPVPGTAASR